MTLLKNGPIAANRRSVSDLLGILRCPRCRAELICLESELRCTAPNCRATYPCVDGIPILIDEGKSVFRAGDSASARDTFFPKRRFVWWKSIGRKLMPSISSNIAEYRLLQSLATHVRALSHDARILILGGGLTGGGAARLRDEPGIICIETDVVPGPRTSVVCDAHSLPFEDGSLSAVVAQAVLEHVCDPWVCVQEIHRVLAPRGLCYIETPFMQQVHGGKYDFYRFTDLGHRRLLRHFEEIERGICCGPGMALAWSWTYFLRSLCDATWIKSFLTWVGHLTSFWLKYLDRLLSKRRGAYEAASGFYFLGRKAQQPLDDRQLARHLPGTRLIRWLVTRTAWNSKRCSSFLQRGIIPIEINGSIDNVTRTHTSAVRPTMAMLSSECGQQWHECWRS